MLPRLSSAASRRSFAAVGGKSSTEISASINCWLGCLSPSSRRLMNARVHPTALAKSPWRQFRPRRNLASMPPKGDKSTEFEGFMRIPKMVSRNISKTSKLVKFPFKINKLRYIYSSLFLHTSILRNGTRCWRVHPPVDAMQPTC